MDDHFKKREAPAPASDIDEDEIRAQVRKDIESMDTSPAHSILLSMGIFEDMEVCRRAVMLSKSNKTIYLYSNKLNMLKQYASIFKESAAVTKIAKFNTDNGDDDGASSDNFDGAEVSLTR